MKLKVHEPQRRRRHVRCMARWAGATNPAGQVDIRLSEGPSSAMLSSQHVASGCGPPVYLLFLTLIASPRKQVIHTRQALLRALIFGQSNCPKMSALICPLQRIVTDFTQGPQGVLTIACALPLCFDCAAPESLSCADRRRSPGRRFREMHMITWLRALNFGQSNCP